MTDNRLDAKEIATRQKQRAGVIMNAKKELSKGHTAIEESPVDLKAIQVIAVKLRDYQKRIRDFAYEIQDALSSDAQDDDIEKMSELDDEIMDMLANLEITVEMRKDEMIQNKTDMLVQRSESHDVSSASSIGNSRIRLPRIELRTYNGDPSKWDEFWDYYDITFHSNADIPIIEKFTYLRSLMAGDALRLVDGYRLTEANYEEVIKALKDRFGDPEIAIFHHFDAMLTLRVATDDVKDLQRIYDSCEAHIRSLIALGLGEDTFGKVFAPILLSKLPGNVRVELIRKKGREAWTLSKLRDLLRDELYARDMSKRSFGGSKQNETRQGNNSSHAKIPYFNGKSRFTASALSNAEKNLPDRTSLKCIFCGGAHFNNKCTTYITAESRRHKMRGSCYCCLGSGHAARDCKRKKPCYFCRNTSHHQSLCEKKFSSRAPGNAAKAGTQLNIGSSKPGISNEKSITSTIMSHGGQRGVLQTAVTNIVGMNGSTKARHLLDNGSDNSFISNDLAKQIGARCIGTEKISLAGFADSKRRQQSYKVYEFDIMLGSGARLPVKAYGTDVIICSIDKLAFDLEKYPILTRVSLAEPLANQNEHVPVDVLIGSDYYYEIVKTERIPLSDGLILLDSELGYIVAGRTNSSSETAASMLLSRSPVPESNFNIERFWKLEEIGVKEASGTSEDELALSKFNQSIQFDEAEQRYLVKWPFKCELPELPNNFGLAIGRLKSMIGRANSTGNLLEKCQQVLDGQLQKNIIEEAPDQPDGPTHYLPHHPVVTPDKATTKVRIVYDASSKTRKEVQSLNDCMYRGPVMLENLCGLLLRFRLRRIGITSDIEKAFLQVGLQKEDRDVTRFLWLRDTRKPCSTDNLVHYRFRRVCFGVVASPFLLAATLTHHLKKIGTKVADRILTNLYVDNVIDGDETIVSAQQYYKEAKQIFQSASMNLREWYSNSKEFMDSINVSDRGLSAKTKVLGLTWDLKADTISCSFADLTITNKVTKRAILQTTAKVFDPCGFLTPITSPAKWLLQELWQKKFDWDAPLDKELTERWSSILSNLQKIPLCKIPRCCGPVIAASSLQLHAFCDASAKAYCAAVYLVMSNDSTSTSSLLLSKCRVSPLQQQSIPRLELLAATIGIRLIKYVESELRLQIGARYLWSDSQCVLHWILGKPVSTVFVRNRVSEIKETSNVEFRFVPTAQNPADLPTRGMKFDDFQNSSLWWHGPNWLTDEASWPTTPITAKDTVHDFESKQPTAGRPVTNMTTLGTKQDGYFLDTNRISSLSKLLRITAWIRRFLQNSRKTSSQKTGMTLRSQFRKTSSHVMGSRQLSSYLTADEIQRSKLMWELAVQKQHFEHLFVNKRKTGEMKSLGPLFVNSDGLICCSSRLANTDLPEFAKSPKLLPKDDQFTRLIVQDYHEKFNHAGVKQTLAEIRCEYWIVHGRTVVKQVINKCLLCRRQKGGSFEIPPEPNLPDFRVTRSAPFATVGVDYLGPLLITTKKTSTQKVWICLFTCAVTRAVHLEVIEKLDSEKFLLCRRRFMSLHGCPKLVVSDNAGQFSLSQRVLSKMWYEICSSRDVQQFSASKEIGWKFVTECAPWMGGFYERLVGVVKTSLKAAIDRKKLNFVELQTVVYEVVAIVNSRPLVYTEDEIEDVAITPAHLLMRHRTIQPFVSVGEPADYPTSTQDKLIAGWKRLQGLLDLFWSHWQKQYLLSLREKLRIGRQRNVVRTVPFEGQIVLIEDKTMPRCQWRIARIVKTIPSADNRIRSVRLRLSNGNTIARPIKQLYPLELSKF